MAPNHPTKSFRPPTFFPVARARSEAEGNALCDLMPQAFRDLGHFTVSGHPDSYGLYAVEWCCHALPQDMKDMDLPFPVSSSSD